MQTALHVCRGLTVRVVPVVAGVWADTVLPALAIIMGSVRRVLRITLLRVSVLTTCTAATLRAVHIGSALPYSRKSSSRAYQPWLRSEQVLAGPNRTTVPGRTRNL